MLDRFSDLVDFCRAHQEQHPDHGYNCICMDEAIRRVRFNLRLGLGVPERDAVINRVQHVVNVAINSSGRAHV